MRVKRQYEAPGYYKQKLVSGMPTGFKRMAPKLGRNEFCPCGSGLKFKKCHKTEDELLKAAHSQKQAELKQKEIQENL